MKIRPLADNWVHADGQTDEKKDRHIYTYIYTYTHTQLIIALHNFAKAST
jgi:hypothetical protein